MPTYNVGNFKETYLSSAITNSDTTIQVAAGTGASMPDAPCLAIISKSRSLYDLKRGEIIEITAKSTDNFTVTRGMSGTTPAAHAAGKLILFNIFAEHISFTNELYDNLTIFLAYALGQSSSGIIATTYNPRTDLQVTENTPDMKIRVLVGNAMINFVPTRLKTEYVSGNLTAPVSHNRIDLIQLVNDGTIEIKTGSENVSPVAPSADADAIALATILLTPSTTSITNGDITDVRSFY